MNKERFNNLLKDYSHLGNPDKDLDNLMMEFPYSQPVRMLNIKSSTSLTKKAYQQRLSLAAFYTTDRNVLRSLIEKGKVPSDFGARAVPPVKKQPVTEQKAKTVKNGKAAVEEKAIKLVEKKPQTVISTSETKITASKPSVTKQPAIDANQLRDEVLANLKILQETKATFLKLTDLDTPKVKKDKKVAVKKPTTIEKAVKEQEIIPPAKVVTAATRKPAKSPKTKKNELIDKFIADEPRITPGKAVKENQSDLSKASSELKEDLVSENLAIIFAKQGKNNKAIEIYKKLIWKFPQKKASFAARIEELKKK